MAAFHVSFTVVVLENEVMYGAQFEMSEEANESRLFNSYW